MTPTDPSSDPLLGRLHELENETDTEFVIELIDIYLNETPKQIQAIHAAVTAKNSSALMISSHTLKGSSLNLGAKQLGALCLKLEELGRAGKTLPENINTEGVAEEFENVKKLLLEYKQKRST
ncbi:MAG: Hpt domain-containing protein [Ignavibacteriae bacterium]|nr:MAG: Hpt domain-containing protein [Ignavibacteriota bacterium]